MVIYFHSSEYLNTGDENRNSSGISPTVSHPISQPFLLQESLEPAQGTSSTSGGTTSPRPNGPNVGTPAGKTKRERDPDWSDEEVKVLVDGAFDKRKILYGAHNGTGSTEKPGTITNQMKQREWLNIQSK